MLGRRTQDLDSEVRWTTSSARAAAKVVGEHLGDAHTDTLPSSDEAGELKEAGTPPESSGGAFGTAVKIEKCRLVVPLSTATSATARAARGVLSVRR